MTSVRAAPLETERPGLAPAPRLVSIAWRRIQLLVRIEVGDVAPEFLSRLHLAQPGHPPVAPTRASHAAGVACLRFNVLVGPGQRPLPEGEWTLTQALDGDAAAPLALETARSRPPSSPEHGRGAGEVLRIAAGRRDYVVTPLAEGGLVRLRVELRPASEQGLAPLPDTAGASWRAAAPWRAADRMLARGFRFSLRILRALPRFGRPSVVFVSELSAGLTGNLAAIRDRMVERGLDREYGIRAVTRRAPTARWRLADVVRLPWWLARADTVVTDGHVHLLLVASWQVRTVQVWHAYGAFKLMSYSLAGRDGGPSPFSRALKGYAAVTVGSDDDVPVYAEAFGLPEARVHPTGIPRLDAFFDPARREVGATRARAALPEAAGRRVILLAPTYRGRVREAVYDMSRLDLEAVHRLCVELDAIFVVRLHPFVRTPPDIPEPLRDRIIDGGLRDVHINDLLLIVDLLVTDYSSVIYEFSTLGRPMLFFAYDLEAYREERDFYEPYEAFVPGRIVRTGDELLDAIRRQDFQVEKVRPFASRRVGGTDGRSTDRVIDLIVARRPPARAPGDPLCT